VATRGGVTSKFRVLSATDQCEPSLGDELADRAPIPDVNYRFFCISAGL